VLGLPLGGPATPPWRAAGVARRGAGRGGPVAAHLPALYRGPHDPFPEDRPSPAGPFSSPARARRDAGLRVHRRAASARHEWTPKTGKWLWASPAKGPSEFYSGIQSGEAAWFVKASYSTGATTGALAGSHSRPADDLREAKVTFGSGFVSIVSVGANGTRTLAGRDAAWDGRAAGSRLLRRHGAARPAHGEHLRGLMPLKVGRCCPAARAAPRVRDSR